MGWDWVSFFSKVKKVTYPKSAPASNALKP